MMDKCKRVIIKHIRNDGDFEFMNSALNNQNEKITVDEDVERLQNDLKTGRFTLDFDGMDTMTVLQRAEYIRHSFYDERIKRPENAKRLVNDVNLESDREDYLPNVHFICEKMIASSEKRYERAESALASAQNRSNVRPGKKAASERRSIDDKLDAGVAKQLSEERKKIDAQKRVMERYIKMAPDSSYAALISDMLRQNEKSYQLALQYLSSKATVAKYERYEKLGVLVEEEKKLCILAKEKEQAAKLCLDNHKQSCYVLQERNAILRYNNKTLMMEARAGLLHCAKDTLAFIAVPKEMTERLLEQGLTESEGKYYDALQAKQNLIGFHPFKKMALDRRIKRAAEEYNEKRAFLTDTRESKLRHPPLTTLEEWKKQNGVQAEKIVETDDDLFNELPVEIPVDTIDEKPMTKQPIQLYLGDKMQTHKVTDEPVFKKETVVEKKSSRFEKEL